MRIALIILPLVLLVGCKPPPDAMAGEGQGRAVIPKNLNFETHVEPLIIEYCYDCHGDDMDKGGLALDQYANYVALLEDKKTWARVRENLITHAMPPPDKPQPSKAEFAIIKHWLDREMFSLDPANPDPGRVTIRRLNRQEYNNSIRDLLGIDLAPAADFPQDNTGYGFDNIGDVLSLSPLQLEKYLRAAEQVLDEALKTAPPPPPLVKIESTKFDGGQMASANARVLSDSGATWTDHTFPEPGDYKVVAKAYADQAGNEPAKMSLDVISDGLPHTEFEVRAVGASPALYEVRVRQKSPGKRKIEIKFLNDYYVEAKDGKPAQDRNLYVEYVAVEGPLPERDYVEPRSHKKIFVVQPASEDDFAAAEQIVQRFAYRAFRRPPKNTEVEKLMGYVKLARAQGDSLDFGIRLALQSVLISPQFLFRGELQEQPDNAEAIFPITEFDLAARLSYFIWSSTPDERLLVLAEQGALRKNLRAEVQRMLDDPRSFALAENFAGQWLNLRAMESVSPDREIYPLWDEALRAAMIQETRLFFVSIQREDRSVFDFIRSDYSFVNERLASHYGIDGVKGPYFQRVRLDTRTRGGLLGQASFLTLTSNPTRTSPVKRGKWVLDNILGTPPPPAPPLVPPIEETEKEGQKLSFREMLELHAAKPGCAGCHKLMDPIGLGLENFDGIGVWRVKDDGLTIDPAGQLNDAERFSGFAELRDLLLNEKKDLFARSLVKIMMTYALGRGLEISDELEVERAVAHLAQHEYRFSELVWAVVDAAPFQMRRGDNAGAALAKPVNIE